MVPSADSTYLRLSLMRPRRGQSPRALALIDKLVEYYANQPGYIDAYMLAGQESAGGEIGRVTLWRSEQDANHVAMNPHVLALRAELLRCVEDESDVERGFDAKTGPLGAAMAL